MSNNKQQTAVEWLEVQLNENGKLSAVDFYQAKEMEKEQMDKVSEDWFVEGCSHMKDNKRIYQSFYQYYNETYNTKKP